MTLQNPSNRSNRLSFFLFLVLKILPCYAQMPFSWHYTHDQGLPSNTIYKIYLSKSGILYFGTSLGITKFDGNKFINLSLPGINDNEVLWIEQDIKGNIWFQNLSGQLIELKNDSVIEHTFLVKQNYKLQNFKIKDSIIYCLYKNIKNRKYFLTQVNIASNIFNPTYLSNIPVDNLCSFDLNSSGYSYLKGESKSSLALIQSNTYGIETCDIETPTNISTAIKHISISDHKIILFTKEKVALLKDDQIIHEWKFTEPINSCKLIDGQLYICTQSGLYILNLLNYQFKLYFDCYNISDVVDDKNGFLWISTLYDGILAIPSLHIIEYNKSYGKINNNNIFCLLYDDQINTIYGGTNSGYIFSVDTSDIVNEYKVSNDRILSLANYDNTHLLFGGDQVFGKAAKSLKEINFYDHKISLKYLMLNAAKEIYTCAGDQLTKLKLKNNNIDSCSRKIINYGRVYAVYEDLNKNLWIGTNDGLYIKNNTDSIFLLEKNICVSQIISHENNKIWVGTSGNGIYIYHDMKLEKRLIQSSILLSNNISCIKIDKLKRTWIGTNKGIQIIDGNDKTTSLLNIFNYLPNEETKSIVFDPNNAWIGTMNGLIKIPFDLIISDTSLPWFTLHSITVNSSSKNKINTHQFQYHENNLLFELSSLSYKNKGYENYYYRLTPNDTNWNATTSRQIRFTSLPPGSYCLEIKNSNSSGFISAFPKKYYFEILKPWWLSLPFYLALAILLFGTILAFQNYQLKIIQNREKLKAEFQNKIDLLSNEALRSQMNPHFIYNTLNAIQDYILINDKNSAIDYLVKFANMTRMVFLHSASTFIKLSEEIEFIKLYLEFEKLRFEDKIQIQFLVEPKLQNFLHTIKIPPLIVQPLIENVFKHGNLSKRNPGILKITYSLAAENILECTIEDNGFGNNSHRSISNTFIKDKNRSSLQIVLARMDLYYKNYEGTNINFYEGTNLENNTGYKVNLKFPFDV